jgi:class 3 adenylate cyclase
VDTAGDGLFATFDRPVRAIRDSLAELGIEIRAGLHTGEVERQGRTVSGLAVHVGARAAASSVNPIMQPARFRTRIRTGGPRGLTPLADAEPAVIIAGLAICSPR